ncbi:hypothetical protein [Glycomyces paridis]|uniref:SMI1/KNR4 family protein n=1 Tax=Glycomyces paridis TaxID=2126555 RepID=A0A4S8PHV7_9ACTN|nr:hypothetical protein [Glycomyces paridis]THV30160.1 hypothetical protein E9998_07255 [Glycomyces paridis]
MTDHLASLQVKVERLQTSGALEALAARWFEDEGEEEAEDPDGIWDRDHLVLADPAEPVGDWPGGLADWFRLAGSATFGVVDVDAEAQVRPVRPVDSLGEPVDDRRWLRIGSVGGEDLLIMDAESGEVAVYFNLYFKYGWESPLLLRRPGVLAFLDTVAIGPDYRLVRGPVVRQRDPWWDADPWFRYLAETGAA